MSSNKDEPKSWPSLVAQFTRAAAVGDLPSSPIPLNREKVIWLTRMMMSELWELCATVAKTSPGERHVDATNAIFEEALSLIDRNGDTYSPDPIVRCAQQADAIVDSAYYSLNVAAAHGIDLDPIFRLVHRANMNKVNPETGVVRRSSDGKIMKPPGWTPPDVESEIRRQYELSSE